VAGDDFVTPVSCDEPNDGEIVDVVSFPGACPLAAEAYVEDGADVFCVDES
jgi:hypothetical protein